MTFRRARRRTVAAFAMALVAPCWLGGCGRSSRDGVTIRFWAMGREGEVVTAFIPEFERTHPGVHVDVQQLPWSAAHEKLLTAFAGRSTPDICQLGNTWIPEFAAINALEPLSARAARSSSVMPGDYFAGIWDTNVINEEVYGVPWYVDTRLIFYRRDLLRAAGFDAPPRDWDEWKRMLAAVQAKAGRDRFAILLPTTEVEPLLALALQQEEPLLREGGRFGNFESAGFSRALTFYLDIFQQGYTPRASAADIANVWNEFGRGYFAFYVSGPWNIGELQRRLPAGQQASWTTAALPGPNGPGVSTAGGSSLVLFRGSPVKDVAWELIEYLSTPEVQRRFHAMTGDLPPRRESWNDERLAADEKARAFRDQLERVKPAPKVPEWERIATQMQIVAEHAVHGDLSAADAARELDARTDAILEKRRWLLARGAPG